MKKQVPPDQEARINEQMRRGRDLLASGDIAGAEAAYLAAWNAIPEPRLDYDFHPQVLLNRLVTFYRDHGLYEQAREWLGTMQISYGEGNQHVDFLRGTVAFRAGNLDEAFEIFAKQFRSYGARPFKGEDAVYLDFYKNVHVVDARYHAWAYA